MDTVDATELQLHPDDWARDAVLWFQMPWMIYGGTDQLIQKFLASAAAVQDPGAYLILGMCSAVTGLTDHKYFEQCRLPQSVTTPNYELVGINRGVVAELLGKGYSHHSGANVNIHWYIKDGMVLLVFKRVRFAPCSRGEEEEGSLKPPGWLMYSSALAPPRAAGRKWLACAPFAAFADTLFARLT